MATFEIYKRTDNQFGWRLKSANGQTIGIGGEGFATKSGAENGIKAVKRDAPTAPAMDLTQPQAASPGFARS
ncbi:MAG: DUF1508 domain-containing protein [Actinobacteria bacterium]|nr:DUF1508 domain-containing protein [Actinomycetota bacterium]